MLFKANYIKKKGRVSLFNWQDSLFDEMIRTVSYVFPAGVMIRSVYSKSRDDGMSIKHPQFGYLISCELYYDRRRIFRIKGGNSLYYIYSIILEALENRLASENQDVVSTGDITIVREYDKGIDGVSNSGFNFTSEYVFLLALLMHTSYGENDQVLDVDEIVNATKSDVEVKSISVEHIRGLMHKLVDFGIPIMFLKRDNLYYLSGTC